MKKSLIAGLSLVIILILAILLTSKSVGVWGEVVTPDAGDKLVVTIQSENGDYVEKDISDWQTYRNEELDFEFRFPQEGELTESLPTSQEDIDGGAILVLTLPHSDKPIAISSAEQKPIITLKSRIVPDSLDTDYRSEFVDEIEARAYANLKKVVKESSDFVLVNNANYGEIVVWSESDGMQYSVVMLNSDLYLYLSDPSHSLEDVQAIVASIKPI